MPRGVLPRSGLVQVASTEVSDNARHQAAVSGQINTETELLPLRTSMSASALTKVCGYL